ncbi:Peptidase S11 D-alanyl-D-alanine carboxypeptidase A N-terminal domain-containing protein [Candidatus Xenohaliotis californiensis]|uniref:Peptidase S11 D-alanyl-D-alanine carboxypeptidase A N-terminal domain-containing protein n=1 Tax=Candidatus Xenohaliotis californiensis TaxID=84677 RepID=A0ABM9N9G1_9RICK|nr:Peptidase S11 D-alanyl-D-alanine carboxypeptidase A N-terminal domain-containing protein [Candidatus Xenohaliotis californiensis]
MLNQIVIFFLICTVYVIPFAVYANENKHATLLIRVNDNTILYQKNANLPRHPASLTKLMTAYIIFDQLKHNKITMNQQAVVSKYASSMIPSKIKLQPGEKVKIKDLIRAIIIASANDAAVAAAEMISGTEAKFAVLMNQKAKNLGMHDTKFKNASGLHNQEQISTANDMAKLAISLHNDFPQHYHFFSETHFVLKGLKYLGHNIITEIYEDVDGLKTGFTNASGHNLITSIQKDGQRLLGIIMGRQSLVERDLDMIVLLRQGFGKPSITGSTIPKIKHKPQ